MSQSLFERRASVSSEEELSIKKQCELLGIHKSGVYYKPVSESEENLAIMRLLDEQYLKTPYYGVRRIVAWLATQGYVVNKKRASRLMQLMGWQTIYRAPRTTISDATSYKYPYLLKDLKVERVNQVWQWILLMYP